MLLAEKLNSARQMASDPSAVAFPESVAALLLALGIDRPDLERRVAEMDRLIATGRMVQQKLIDWPAILGDLAAGSINAAMVARKLGKRRSTVGRWRKGSEPSFSVGCALIALHVAISVRTAQRNGMHAGEHQEKIVAL